VETPSGPARGISYRTPFDRVEHMAVVFGDVAETSPVAVRLHRETVVRDVFSTNRTLERAMARLAKTGGILIYLRDGSAGVPAQSLAASVPQADIHESHGSAKMRDEQWREIGTGAQILRDLGATKITLIAQKSRRYIGLAGFGIEIVATEMLEG
jgi:3,4-dihydroxy 2-butanone 4-phosphate synthase/GTP cyclohydrolase II